MNENETEDIMHHVKMDKSASSSAIEVAKNGIPIDNDNSSMPEPAINSNSQIRQ